MLSSAEIASMTTVVASSLDQSLPLYRPTKTDDGYGHTKPSYPDTSTFTLACNITKPSADQLQLYADVIAGKRALMLRYMPTSDVREGDKIVYQNLPWLVQPVESAESYTFANEVVITTVG